jgi:hypothetical protein
MIDCGFRFAKTVCVRARRARSLSSSVAMRAADVEVCAKNESPTGKSVDG